MCRDEKDPGKCHGCEYSTPPPLLPDNLDAFDLWQEVNTQWRAGGFGVIGLDYAECRTAAGEIGVDWNIRTKRKLQALERFELKRLNGGNK